MNFFTSCAEKDPPYATDILIVLADGSVHEGEFVRVKDTRDHWIKLYKVFKDSSVISYTDVIEWCAVQDIKCKSKIEEV